MDPYFPIGQAALDLRAEAGTISVSLKTTTPNFNRYEVRTDGSGWKSFMDHFVWSLHPGPNRLEARTVNQFGVHGPISTAELELSN